MTAGRKVNTQSHHWCTPEKYVAAVRRVFGGVIDLDPCSNKLSIVSATTEYKLPLSDGLQESWNYERIYVNPPYGSDPQRHTSIRDWLARCSHAHDTHQSEVIALVPVATNTSHWKLHVFGAAAAVSFLRDTRLKFMVDGVESKKGAPMACAMVYYGVRFDSFDHVFSEFGAVVDIRRLRKGRKQ